MPTLESHVGKIQIQACLYTVYFQLTCVIVIWCHTEGSPLYWYYIYEMKPEKLQHIEDLGLSSSSCGMSGLSHFFPMYFNQC